MSRSRIGAAAMVALAFSYLAGCGEKKPVGPEKTRVTGKVTLDGNPLPFGQIIFVDAEGTPPRQYGGEIKNGVYSVESTPGKKKVEISATASSTGSKDPGADLKQIIPPQFNQQTTLTAEIPPDGKGTFDYNVTSDAKK